MTRPIIKRVFTLLTTSALVLATAACTAEQGTRNFNASTGATSGYVQEALADQGDLTVFYQALRTTGVLNELNDNTEYTIFAPTNAAFAQIGPRTYPCFYAVQCRSQVAAVLRNHIVPRNETVSRFSKWGGDIPTLGTRHIDVEEPYKGHYTVEGYRVLYHNELTASRFVRGNKISLYRIDGVIANDQDMAPFRTVPYAQAPVGVMEKTVTTYRAPMASGYVPQTLIPDAYLVPGGQLTPPVVYINTIDTPVDAPTDTTTVTHTTTK